MVQINPLLQGRCFIKSHGHGYRPKDILSPEQEFEAAVTTTALLERMKEEEYMEETKQATTSSLLSRFRRTVT
jgi:hypothetical protein